MKRKFGETIDLGDETVRTDLVRYEKSFHWKICNYLQWTETVSGFAISPVFQFNVGSQHSYKFNYYLMIGKEGDTVDRNKVLLYWANCSSEDIIAKFSPFIIQKDGAKFYDLQSRPSKYENFQKITGDISPSNSITGIGPQDARKIFSKMGGLKILDVQEFFREGSVTFGATIEVMLPKCGDTVLELNKISQKTLLDVLGDEFEMKSLKRNDSKMERFSDFLIECGETTTETFACHRFFLSLRSPVFEAMLTHDTKEGQQGKVCIPDVTPKTMNSLLQFFYTDRVEDDMIDADLLATANKYQVESLKAICEEYLARHLTIDNAAELAIQGELCGSPLFKEAIINFIVNHWNQIKETDSFDILREHKI